MKKKTWTAGYYWERNIAKASQAIENLKATRRWIKQETSEKYIMIKGQPEHPKIIRHFSSSFPQRISCIKLVN